MLLHISQLCNNKHIHQYSRHNKLCFAGTFCLLCPMLMIACQQENQFGQRWTRPGRGISGNDAISLETLNGSLGRCDQQEFIQFIGQLSPHPCKMHSLSFSSCIPMVNYTVSANALHIAQNMQIKLWFLVLADTQT